MFVQSGELPTCLLSVEFATFSMKIVPFYSACQICVLPLTSPSQVATESTLTTEAELNRMPGSAQLPREGRMQEPAQEWSGTIPMVSTQSKESSRIEEKN